MTDPTTHSVQPEGAAVRLAPMPIDDLAQERFISLKTYRRTGEAVATPVWFAVVDGALVAGTFSTSGKVKRLKHTSKVQVAPCNFRGLVKSTYLEAIADFGDSTQSHEAAAALEEKYGWQWSMFSRKVDIYLRISLPG